MDTVQFTLSTKRKPAFYYMQLLMLYVHTQFERLFAKSPCELRRIHVCEPSNETYMGTAIVWNIMQCMVVIRYRRFGTTYRAHLQESRNPRDVPKRR